jgi:hypothetical protein
MIDIEQFLMSLRRHTNADGKLNPIYLADTIQEEIEIIQGAIKHSQRWVGLSDEEIQSCWDGDLSPYQMQCIREIEDKLRSRNI